MNHLVVDGCPPWDGEYPFEFTFTNAELHVIKQSSVLPGSDVQGIRGGELMEAIWAEDSGAYVGLAVVVLARHGKTVTPSDFWEADRTAIKIRLGDAGPPEVTPSGSEQSENTGSSGPSSDATGD